MSDLFRKKALEKLSSPDQLDQLIKVTNIKGWLALSTIGMLVILLVVWSIFSRIPERVSGQGVFIRPGGLIEISAPSSGKVKDIYVRTGDIINAGTPIARIDQQAMLEDIKARKLALIDMEQKLKDQKKKKSAEASMEEDIYFDNRRALREKLSDLKQQASWLEQKLVNQQQLYAEGLIVSQSVVDTKSALASVQQQIHDTEGSFKQAKLNLRRQFGENDNVVNSLVEEIVAGERELDRKLLELETASKVVSPYTCRVIEIASAKDSVVSAGATIVTVELLGDSVKSLEAVLYFPASEGGKIERGMNITISPASVKQEEYGFILGLVASVSKFPASRASMMSALHNESMVQVFSGGGAVTEVRANLIPSTESVSGYKWSSGRGPNMLLGTGTLCGANVIVNEKRPISFVIPLMKKHVLGIEDNR